MSLWSRSRFGVAAALTSGVLFMLSRDTAPFGPLVLVAPIPILLFAMTARRSRAVAAWSLVTGILARLSLLHSYAAVLPTAMLLLWLSTFAAWFMAIVLLTRWFARNGSTSVALLSYPMLTAATEFLFGTVSPHGSFGALGYSIAGILPVVQLASIGGVAALTFLAAFVPMAAVVLILRRGLWPRIALAAGIPLVIVAGFGWLRLLQPYAAEKTVTLAAIDALQDDETADPQAAAETFKAYAALVAELARAHPDIILLPEKSLRLKQGWLDTEAALQAVADQSGVAIVAGYISLLHLDLPGNEAVVYRPHRGSARYLKRRLIPGLEDGFASGERSLVLGDLGVAICKDMDFAPMIREYGESDVRLMLVPAWDFRSDSALHARMAVVRGVENGFAVVRAAAEGLLTVSDAYGRMIAEQPTSTAQPVTLSATVGLISGGTVYSRIGDVFGWLTVLGCVLLAMLRRVQWARVSSIWNSPGGTSRRCATESRSGRASGKG